MNLSEGRNDTDSEREMEPQWIHVDTFIGLTLAFLSCLFIGVSVIFKKLALQDLEAKGRTRAVDGGYGYLRIPRWWVGISLMGFGELTNFVAYIFAPAVLVTPLGVFSIVWTAALSPYFLKEKLRVLGKLGCLLVLVGCIIVTLCGPKDREISSMEELQTQLLHPGFLVYASLVVFVSALFMVLVPRYGHRYVLLYITICSSFGSLSVMFCKGVGLALKETVGGRNEFTNWATWACLVGLIVSLLIETVYMQRALDLFNSSVFMSVNYVLFTTLVIIASSILYTELKVIGMKNIIMTLLGFVVNIVALFLLHLDKEENPPVESGEEVAGGGSAPPKASPQVGKLTLAGEQGTPLLSRGTPASPLAGLNLPRTMFPNKTNSCMSLISQSSLHHAPADSHQPPHDSAHDSAHDTSSSSSSNDSTRRRDATCNSPSGHCRSSSGCMCEVPLLNELHTSSKLRPASPSATVPTDSSTGSLSSKASELHIPLQEEEGEALRGHSNALV